MDENLSGREVKQAQAAPDLDAKVLAALLAHPSRKLRDDGVTSYSLNAYQEIAEACGVTPARVSEVARKNGIRRKAENAEPKPHIGKASQSAKSKAKLSKPERELLCDGIAKGFGAIYGIVAQVRDESHWMLEQDEGEEIAGDLLDAVDTLEGSKAYEEVIVALSKVLPWGLLGATIWRITEPRIAESRSKRAQARTAKAVGSSAAAYNGVVSGSESSGTGHQDAGHFTREADELSALSDFETAG